MARKTRRYEKRDRIRPSDNVPASAWVAVGQFFAFFRRFPRTVFVIPHLVWHMAKVLVLYQIRVRRHPSWGEDRSRARLETQIQLIPTDPSDEKDPSGRRRTRRPPN